MIKGAVARILNFSAVDGPGNRMVIFFQGCNLNCCYCHNPETIPLGKATSEGYQWVDVEHVLHRYAKAKDFISGVTVSGGECTVQYSFLLELCKRLKQMGAHILIDSNGQLDSQNIDAFNRYVDGWMLDIKAVESDVHQKLTGCSNQQILETFRKLLKEHKLVEVRTVLLDGWADNSLKTVAWVSENLSKTDKDVPYRLIRYRAHGVRKANLKFLELPSEALVRSCVSIARQNGLKTVILV